MRHLVKTCIYILCFCILSASCSQRKDEQSAVRNVDSNLDSLVHLWNQNNRTGMHESTIISARSVLFDALKRGDSVTALYAGIFTAQSYLFMDTNLDSAKYYADQIARFVANVREPSLKINFDNIMGSYYLKKELDYSKALEYYLDGLDYAVKFSKSQAKIVMLANIVNIFYLRRDESGMKYAEQAYEAGMQEGVSDYSKCISLIPIAQMLCLSSEPAKAEVYAKEAMDLAYRTGAVTTYSIINAIYAELRYSEGNLASAEDHYDTAIGYADNTDPGTASMIFLKYGNMLEKEGRLDKALEAYLSGLEILKISKNMEFRQELMFRTAMVYSKMGMTDKALPYAVQYMMYSDSTARHKEMDFNKLILRNSDMLHEKQMLEKEIERQKSDRRFVNTIFILILVLAFAFFISILYRRQRKSYRRLVAQHIAAQDSGKAHVKDKVHNRKDIYLKSEQLMKTDKTYRQKDLTQEKFASIVGTNRTYLSQAINEYAGMSFSSWVNMYRISEATAILSDPNNSISLKQLADDLGYNSVSVFHKAFQKGTGLTPNTWRKQNVAQQPT